MLSEIKSLGLPGDQLCSNLGLIQASIEASTLDLARRLPRLADNFGRAWRQLQSCGFTKKPHKEALNALGDVDCRSLFSARFPGVFQPAESDRIFVFGRECATNADINTGQLCELLNSMEPLSLDDIATSISANSSVVRDILTKFYLLGALVQP